MNFESSQRHIEIVTHCFRYTTLLRLQLSSLVYWPPESTAVTVTVLYTSEDRPTSEVLSWFERYSIRNLTWNWIEQPVNQLCRRSIGRNLAALQSTADWIWFCDADYLFTQDCWDSFASDGLPDEPLIYPREFQTQKRVIHGDQLIEKAAAKRGLVLPDLRQFRPQRYDRAIGGIQIMKGDIGRRQGYLKDHPDAQQPREDGVWRRTFEDVWFRKQLGTAGIPADIVGVYRVRHSKAGRNITGLRL